MEKQFTLIQQAIKEIPKFRNYIEQIKTESTTPREDLQALEFILQNHTIKQVYDFLPRFVSLL